MPIYTTYLPTITAPCIDSPQRGYAYAWGNYNGNVTAYPCDGWWYNWTARKPVQDYGIGFVPTVQCEPFKHKTWPNDDVEDLASSYGHDYKGYVIVLNEPDWNQCPTTPGDAAVFMEELEIQFPNVKWVGPNVTQNGGGWLSEFVSIYDGDNLAGVGIHSYSLNGNDAQPQARLDEAIAIWDAAGWDGVDIWITEFGTDDVAKMRQYMDVYQHERVERVAYFAPIIPREQPGIDKWPYPESSLFDEDSGELTAVGKIYLNR